MFYEFALLAAAGALGLLGHWLSQPLIVAYMAVRILVGPAGLRWVTVIYTTIGKPRKDDPLYPVYVQFERFRAAQYRRELSDKVWRGCLKMAEQGYWAGGPARQKLPRRFRA